MPYVAYVAGCGDAAFADVNDDVMFNLKHTHQRKKNNIILRKVREYM